MFLLLSQACKNYIGNFLPLELEDIFYYLLRNRTLPFKLTQDIKLLHQDYNYINHRVHIESLLSVLLINLNDFSHNRTNIDPLKKHTYFCGVQILNNLRNIDTPVYYENQTNSYSAGYTKLNDFNPELHDITNLSICLKEFTFEDYKHQFQCIDDFNSIETYPEMNDYFAEIDHIKTMINLFLSTIVEEHTIPLQERKIKGIAFQYNHFKKLYGAILKTL